VKKQNELLSLFFTMLKLGAFTFGGGYAMIPLIEDEFVNRKKWVDSETLTDIIALAQSVPGAIAVNTAVIIGYRKKGLIGSLIAILGLALPSLITLTLITYLYESFSTNLYVAAVLKGIRACVVGLIFSAFVRLFIPLEKSVYTMTLLITSFLISLLTDVNSVYLIISALIIGLLSSLFNRRQSS